MAKKQEVKEPVEVRVTDNAIKFTLLSAVRYFKFTHQNSLPDKIVVPLPKSYEGVPVEYIEAPQAEGVTNATTSRESKPEQP